MSFHSALYRGELVHARDDEHARRVFRYGVMMAALDLDELATLDRELRLFSHGGANLFAFRDRDYASATSPSTGAVSHDLRGELAALRAANGLPPPHATRAVTNLRAFGYLFNPVSFFFDYDARGEIIGAIAEVNNTYGGNLRYVLGPAHRVAGAGARFRHVRELFVSPFLHGELTYEFDFAVPLDGDELAIAMHVRDARGHQVFFAKFAGARTQLSDRSLALAALRYPFMTAQVIGLIHWQALKLRLAGVPYVRPRGDHRPIASVARRP
ncbi:MAG: DUF1365 domain-containing protein [Deltaproteobacteria bacterium]